MTKNMEIKERLLADPCANEDHDPHLYGNKLEDSPAYAAIRKANLLVGEYRREDLADLDLLRPLSRLSSRSLQSRVRSH